VSIELLVLGSSGSGPSRDGPATGYLVRTGGATVLLEAGTGVFMALAAEIDPVDLDAVVVSHVHADHSADLIGLVHYLAYRRQRDRPLPVYAPGGVVDRTAAYLGAGPDHEMFSVVAPSDVADGAAVAIGAASWRFAATTHSVPTVAVRIEHEGRSLAYSADTGLDGGFPALAAGADVVLSEAGLTGSRGAGTYPFHLSGAEAGAIAAAAGGGRLVLTHLAPNLPADEIRAAAAEAFAGPVDLAHPGLRITP
jgi:ribonuclease BN (tRNA processing enzyme)